MALGVLFQEGLEDSSTLTFVTLGITSYEHRKVYKSLLYFLVTVHVRCMVSERVYSSKNIVNFTEVDAIFCVDFCYVNEVNFLLSRKGCSRKVVYLRYMCRDFLSTVPVNVGLQQCNLFCVMNLCFDSSLSIRGMLIILYITALNVALSSSVA